MKRLYKRVFSLLLGLVMMLSISLPVSALSAETAKINTGKWYTARGHSYNKIDGTVYYFYRFKVGSGCYVRVDLKKKGQSEERGLYISKKPDRSLKPVEYVCLKSKETGAGRYIYLPKGTYYASAYDPIRFKITIGKALDQKNYTVLRAAYLAAGRQIVVTQTPTDQYDRWYRIKVTKKQKLTMSSNNPYNIMVYDASFKRISLNCKTGSTSLKTSEKVAKGTYYVRIGRTDTPGRASVTTFSWK